MICGFKFPPKWDAVNQGHIRRLNKNQLTLKCPREALGIAIVRSQDFQMEISHDFSRFEGTFPVKSWDSDVFQELMPMTQLDPCLVTHAPRRAACDMELDQLFVSQNMDQKFCRPNQYSWDKLNFIKPKQKQS